MTCGEWIESDYNTDGYNTDGEYIGEYHDRMEDFMSYICHQNYDGVTYSEVITDGAHYIID